jgi:hypothetical protein
MRKKVRKGSSALHYNIDKLPVLLVAVKNITLKFSEDKRDLHRKFILNFVYYQYTFYEI